MSTNDAGRVTTRIARPDDAEIITQILAEAFENYRAWAPPEWEPPRLGAEQVARLAKSLRDPDVWCLMAIADGECAGHVAISPVTAVRPERAPRGTINLWQLFVREQWLGSGIAVTLLADAVREAKQRGFVRMRLWTPRDAIRGRSFYGREGWDPTGRVVEDSLGLPVVEYTRSLGTEGKTDK